MMVKLSVALPFYAEHKGETCEGKLKLSEGKFDDDDDKRLQNERRKHRKRRNSFSSQFLSTVNIVDGEKKIVARREFVMISKGARCLCLWFCACFCFGSYLTVEANNLCHVMSSKNEFYAGFYDENDLEAIEDEMEESMREHLALLMPLAVLCFVLLIGKFIRC